jgi:hypothetical protein
MSKLFKIGVWVAVVAIILNAVETAYFGFNMHPICKEEEQWDVACKLLLNVGISFSLIGLFTKKQENGNN